MRKRDINIDNGKVKTTGAGLPKKATRSNNNEMVRQFNSGGTRKVSR